MAKWADYCISAVRYSSNGSHIEKVKVHEDKGDKMGAGEEWTRDQVIKEIDNNKSFITITKGESVWQKGQDVHVVSVDGKRYLRTDANKTASDNLANLPVF